jgi:hypothetical protein
MKSLRSFYTNCLISFTVALALTTYVAATYFIPSLESRFTTTQWPVDIVKAVFSRPALLFLIIAAEWIVRTKLWRWIHPEFDFSGTWDGVSTYTHRHIGTGPLPAPVTHEMRIDQDCLSIELIPAEGDKYTSFQSTAANLLDKSRLVYSYYVVYRNDNELPVETYGYEEISATREPGPDGRPATLRGWFAHCVRPDQKSAFSGTVIFHRRMG